MFKLLKKEIVLTACPLSFIFIAFSLMTFIPDGYPITISAFFVCMGIFYTFQYAREYNDTLYTALLPIKKSDVVLAKFVFVVVIQLISFILSAVFTLVIMLFLAKEGSPFVGGIMVNANLSYLGYCLIIYSTFNLLFLSDHFKTAYNIGMPFIKFVICAMVVVGIGEVLHHLPNLSCLNTEYFCADVYAQLIVLAVGVIAYVGLTVLSLKLSQKSFERIDVK